MTDTHPASGSQPAAPAPDTTRSRRSFWRRPPPTAEDLSDRRLRKWAELVETIILTLATFATAWAGYQASQWGNAASTLDLRATAQLIEASQQLGRAQQLELLDVGLFTDWVDATAAGDARLAGFYRDRFRDEFRPAFDAWLATRPLDNPDAPSSPFVMPDYQLAAVAEAEALRDEAGRMSQTAEVVDGYADRYTLLTVILAAALLLAGLGNRFEWEELRAVIVGVALVVLLICVVTLLTLPIT